MSGAPAGRYLVLYDGSCGLCQGTVAWLRRSDWLGRLQFTAFDAHWAELAAAHPGLDYEACAAAMHVIAPSGRTTAGFDGFRTIAWVVPPLWPIAPLLHLPGVAPVGRRVYACVATHRSTSCNLQQRPGPRSGTGPSSS